MFYDKRLSAVFYLLAVLWGAVCPFGSVVDNFIPFMFWSLGMNALTMVVLSIIDNLNPDKP